MSHSFLKELPHWGVRFALAALLTALMFAAPCAASDFDNASLDYYAEHYPPYVLMADGEPSGWITETLYMVWEELGVEARPVTIMPLARANQLMEDEGHAVFFPAAATRERLQAKRMANLPDVKRYVLMSRKDRWRPDSSMEQLFSEEILCIRNGASRQALADAGAPDSSVHEVADISMLVRMLAAYRVPLAFGVKEGLEIELEAQGHNLEDYVVVKEVKQFMGGFLFSPDVPDKTIQRFQKALDAVTKSEPYARLKARYGIDLTQAANP